MGKVWDVVFGSCFGSTTVFRSKLLVHVVVGHKLGVGVLKLEPCTSGDTSATEVKQNPIPSSLLWHLPILSFHLRSFLAVAPLLTSLVSGGNRVTSGLSVDI